MKSKCTRSEAAKERWARVKAARQDVGPMTTVSDQLLPMPPTQASSADVDRSADEPATKVREPAAEDEPAQRRYIQPPLRRPRVRLLPHLALPPLLNQPAGAQQRRLRSAPDNG